MAAITLHGKVGVPSSGPGGGSNELLQARGSEGTSELWRWKLRSRRLSSRESGRARRKEGGARGKKAAEKVAAALRPCQLCDFLLWASWAQSKGRWAEHHVSRASWISVVCLSPGNHWSGKGLPSWGNFQKEFDYFFLIL